MFYLVYFLTLLALFSSFFFICAIHSAAKLDRLFIEPPTNFLFSPKEGDSAVIRIGGKESFALIQSLSSSENGETFITLKITPEK